MKYMYEQFFKLEGWQNKLSLICKGPSWQPGLPRLGNHQYPEISYPIKLFYPNISIALSIYTFIHFLYVLVQYSAVLGDSKVKSVFHYSILLFSLFFVFRTIQWWHWPFTHSFYSSLWQRSELCLIISKLTQYFLSFSRYFSPACLPVCRLFSFHRSRLYIADRLQ